MELEQLCQEVQPMTSTQRAFNRTCVEKLVCESCQKLFTEPRLLNCFHSFCRKCIESYMLSGTSVICRTCRYPTVLDKGSISGLPICSYVESLLEIEKVLKSSTETSVKCGECIQFSEAVSRCLTCASYLCDLHKVSHEKAIKTAGHEVWTLFRLMNTRDVSILSKRRIQICKEHPDSQLKLYCETDSEVLCPECALMYHRSHDVDFIKNIIDGHRKGIKTTLESLHDPFNTVGDILSSLKSAQRIVVENKEKVIAEIRYFVSEYKRLLDMRGQALECQVQQTVEQTLMDLQDKSTNVTSFVEALKAARLFCTHVLSFYSDAELLRFEARIAHRGKYLRNEIIQVEQLQTKPQLSFVRDNDPSEIIQEFGAIQSGLSTKIIQFRLVEMGYQMTDDGKSSWKFCLYQSTHEKEMEMVQPIQSSEEIDVNITCTISGVKLVEMNEGNFQFVLTADDLKQARIRAAKPDRADFGCSAIRVSSLASAFTEKEMKYRDAVTQKETYAKRYFILERSFETAQKEIAGLHKSLQAQRDKTKEWEEKTISLEYQLKESRQKEEQLRRMLKMKETEVGAMASL